MFSKLKNIGNSVKDVALSKGAKEMINTQIADFGKVEELRIDTDGKSLKMEVLLDGEPAPLSVDIGCYELVREGEECYVKLEKIRTSRQWIDTLATLHIEGKLFKIPQKYTEIVEVLL